MYNSQMFFGFCSVSHLEGKYRLSRIFIQLAATEDQLTSATITSGREFLSSFHMLKSSQKKRALCETRGIRGFVLRSS